MPVKLPVISTRPVSTSTLVTAPFIDGFQGSRAPPFEKSNAAHPARRWLSMCENAPHA